MPARLATLVLAAVCVLTAGQATAFAIDMVARGPTTSLAPSDTVTVDVFLDAEFGITVLSVAVLASNDDVLDYDPVASAASPRCPTCTGAGTSGAQPSYILYVGMDEGLLYPVQTPAFLNWPAPPAGQEQVNVHYLEPQLVGTVASATDIWIATLVFHVAQDFETETLSLSLDPGLGGAPGVYTRTAIVPPSTVPLSAPIVLTGTLPEPGTLHLLVAGVGCVAWIGARRCAHWPSRLSSTRSTRAAPAQARGGRTR